MSFAGDTKKELARIIPEKKCCMIAEIAAFIRVAGNLRLLGGGRFEIAVATEEAAVARHFNKLIKEYFNVETTVEISKGETALRKGRSYTVTIGPDDLSEQILRETGILMVREGMNYISDGIYSGLLRTKCCRKSYVRALFLASGTMASPEKEYHFEITSSTQAMAADIRKLFNSFHDITAKNFIRKKDHVTYVKDSGQILDILAIMGANGQYLAYQDVKMKKELRNEANRLKNCDEANIDKSLKAAQRMIRDIEKIGIDELPPKLAEIARLRVENPDLTIEELGALLDPPLKKSGVNSRLKRITAMADKLPG